MNSSDVSNNLQHGLFLENLRNYVIVNSSSITYNGYGAGIRIYSGAGMKSLLHCEPYIPRLCNTAPWAIGQNAQLMNPL